MVMLPFFKDNQYSVLMVVISLLYYYKHGFNTYSEVQLYYLTFLFKIVQLFFIGCGIKTVNSSQSFDTQTR